MLSAGTSALAGTAAAAILAGMSAGAECSLFLAPLGGFIVTGVVAALVGIGTYLAVKHLGWAIVNKRQFQKAQTFETNS